MRNSIESIFDHCLESNINQVTRHRYGMKLLYLTEVLMDKFA